MNSIFTKISIVSAAVLIPLAVQGREVARFPMENSGGRISESVSGQTFPINSVHTAENMPGVKGEALRFDGYSTFIDARIGDVIPQGSKKMTASVWIALETYPIVEIDRDTPEQTAIVSCIDESAKTGFGFFLGYDGKYSFKTYVGGWPLELKVETPLKQYEWINLTAVVDSESRSARLYNNGSEVATSKANGTVSVTNSPFRIGRSNNERSAGLFCTTSFNGLIDEITLYDEALGQNVIADMKPEHVADLSIPAERFADDPMRPSFHGMPGANWSNETHGLTYSNGRYHLFFQKNANGPYMARLHWGHLSSENLYDWREEQVALTPGTPYDIKGCWSGCVFSDKELTDGKPSIIYTGVDFSKAVIARATPDDDNLISWQKSAMPIINGRPAGLSDDFRDPYFFRSESGAYIIVGSSKGGIGTTTLHKYDTAAKTWSNDGKTFFTGSDTSTCGTFWEMPNVTKIGDKWLFTVTPQNTSKGVAALYWTGGINADGTFNPDKRTPANIELPGLARDGFGLLSPTIYQHNGKTIALGIVPDKLPSEVNYELGYAHTYSLPREWSLDNDGNLCQKPYSGLTAMRTEKSFSKTDFTLNGNLTMKNVTGRALELEGVFTIGEGKYGFTFLDDGISSIKVYYDCASNEVAVDARGLDRLINDSGVFDGYYHTPLPRQLAKGETIKLNVFFDHSIIDIFVNDTWASSVRVFAKPKNTENTTAFSTSGTHANYVKGWTLNASAGGSGVDNPITENDALSIFAEPGAIRFENVTLPATLSIHNLSGTKILDKEIGSISGRIPTDLNGFHIVTINSPEGMVSKKLIMKSI